MYTHTLYKTGAQSAADCKLSEAFGQSSPIKFSSEVDFWGNPRVGVYTIIDFCSHQDDGAFVLGKCEKLFETCRELDSQGRLSELPDVVAKSRATYAPISNGLKH